MDREAPDRRRRIEREFVKTRPKVGRAQDLVNINTNLALPSVKPRCMSYYFNLWIIMYAYYLCITFQELFETLDAWSLGFSGPCTSMDRSVALLCSIGLDRSRVIFLSLARYRLSLCYIIWFTIYIQDEMNGNLETGRGEKVSPACVG